MGRLIAFEWALGFSSQDSIFSHSPGRYYFFDGSCTSYNPTISGFDAMCEFAKHQFWRSYDHRS